MPVPNLLGKLSAALSWLRVAALAGLLGAVVGGGAPSCAVSDEEYCTSDAQCSTLSTGLGSAPAVCDVWRHVCVPFGGPLHCRADADCLDASPHCDTETHVCGGCRVGDSTDKSCARLGKFCIDASDGSASTMCVACRTSLDCPYTAPICNNNHQCRPCAEHKDCEGPLNCEGGAMCTDSLVCIQSGDPSEEHVGQCAKNGPGGRVIYVVNDNGSTCNDKINGTIYSEPLCSFDAAWMKAQTPGFRYIRLLGPFDPAKNVGPHSQINIGSGSYSFIGAPGKGYTLPASITFSGLLFSVSGTGSLTLDGLSITQAAAAAATKIKCVETGATPPSITLRHSVLVGGDDPSDTVSNTIPAVFINTCNTILDGNIIGVSKYADLSDPMARVHGTAISISDAPPSGTTYLIENNLIAGNAGAALNLINAGGGTAKITVRFNTIVGNGRGLGGAAGAVYCPSMTPLAEFSHSIVVENYQTTGPTQFDASTFPGRCNFKDVVVGPGEMIADPPSAFPAPFRRLPVDLDPDFRMRVTVNNSACCIDKVTPGGNLPALDVDSIPRPQGAALDIGASEFRP